MQQEVPGRTSQASGPSHVPLAYQYPVVSGTLPVARWAHAAAAVGPFLYIYGGVGPSVLDDLAVLDTELMVWRALAPNAARPKDRPDKLHAAAMCALGNTLWLFGGQQGRKHLRTLYALNTEMLSWRLVTPAGATPAGREGHSLTAVDGSMAYLFGGQGKKLLNDLHVLRQGGSEWVEIKAQGRVPHPRSGHSMVWDGLDRLVCFGGTTAGSTDNSLYVYSLSRNEWFAREASGAIPSPRSHHSAVLLPSNRMLVFGGCNAQGVFFNDAYVLNLGNMHWSRVQPLNTPPPPRYHHSCHVLGGKVVLYGGINPKQAFDAVVLLETNFAGDLGAVAEELAARMATNSMASGPALSRAAASTALGAAVGAPPLVDDLMKLQLRDLLLKRNMEELHITAQQKAEAVEERLKSEQLEKVALQKEVLQLKLISSEAEHTSSSLREQLAEARKALSREQAEHQATSAALSDLRTTLVDREQQLAEARQLLDSMSAELGILSSRFHRLQQERNVLQAEKRAAQRQQRQQGSEQQQPQQRALVSTHYYTQSEQPPGGLAASAVLAQNEPDASLVGSLRGVQVADGDVHSSSFGVAHADNGQLASGAQAVFVSRQQEQQQQQSSTACAVSASSTSVEQVDQPPVSAGGVGSVGHSVDSESGHLLDGRKEPPAPSCCHGQLEAACLLCICQRFLAATAGSCNHLASSSRAAGMGLLSSHNQAAQSADLPAASCSSCCSEAPSAAGLATVAVAACASEAAQYRQFLSISELARNRLEAENASLQQQVTDLQSQVDQQMQQLHVLQADSAALAVCSIQELNALEDTLEASTKAVRQVVLQRSIAEYQRQASAETVRCAVCMEAPRRLAFNCGHQTCNGCGDKISTCPFCRQEITAKIRLFE